MFRKKSLRRRELNRLIEQTEKQKKRLDYLNYLVERSIDPTEAILAKRKIARSLYSFLLREARYQRVNKSEQN